MRKFNALEGEIMDELDGLNRLVFSGPFPCYLSDGREVPVSRLVIASKNGEVANLPVSRLKTTKDIVLNLLSETAKEQSTVSGLRRLLEQGGAIMLGSGFFWLKSETEVHSPPRSIIQKEERPKTIQEFRAIARKVILD